MQQFGKRLLALLLVICAVVGFLPATAFPAAAETETKIVGQQLSLGDDLTMRFYASVGGEYISDAVMNVAACGESTDYAIKNMTANSDGNYEFYVSLSAAEMTEDITLTLTSGQTQLLQKVYSVQDYAHYLLENNYNNETKNLVKEMLNYGTKAQQYFDHKTGDPANAGYVLDETGRTIEETAPSIDLTGSVSNVSLYGCTMIFENKIAVRAYFTAPNGMDGCTVTVGGREAEVHKKGSYYYIEVGGINPDQMDIVLPISVSKDDETLSFKYSPMYYITRMYNKDNTNAGLKALALAAKYYFDAAKVFTGIKEAHTGDLTLGYRYGTNSLIQVNTNVAADIPCVNFTTGDNGCNIDQSANRYQHVGWIEMANVDGTIVLTFRFNAAFEAGQTYFLPKGAVFGFADGSRYTLDKNYTFTFDGSGWTMEAKEDPITLSYRWGEANKIQFNTNLPVSETNGSFTAAENGCTFIENGDTRVGWVGTDNVDGTVVLTFNLSAAAAIGQSYNLGKDSVFVLDDGSRYQLEQDITLYWDGSKWIETVPVFPELSFNQYRYGTENLIQVNTNLPSSTTCNSFLAGANGCNITQGGDQLVGWIQMANVNGTIVLTFHFNNAFTAGQSYTLSAGSIFCFTDGTIYALDGDYTFTYDGSGWAMTSTAVKSVSLTYRWGEANLIQFNSDLPTSVPEGTFLATDNGSQIAQGGAQAASQFQTLKDENGTIVFAAHFASGFAVGEKYTLAKDSLICFSSGGKYRLTEDVVLYWTGSVWSAEQPKITLSCSSGTDSSIKFTTNLPDATPVKDFTTDDNGCAVVQSGDKNVGWIGMSNTGGAVELTFHFGSSFAFGGHYKLSAGSVFGFADGSRYVLAEDLDLYWNGASWVTEQPVGITMTYRYGTNNLIQFNTDLTEDYENFTTDNITQRGGSVIQSGDLTVGWVGVEIPTGETNTVLTFHFSSGSFVIGQSYTLSAGSIFVFADGGAKYTLKDSITLYYHGGETWKTVRPTVTLTNAGGTANSIVFHTDLPNTVPAANFTTDDNGCGFIQSGDQNVGWIGMPDSSELTFHFGADFTFGQSYVLSAGSIFGFTDGSRYALAEDVELYWNGTTWTTEKTSELTLSYRYGTNQLIQFNTNLPTTTPRVNFTTDKNGCSLIQGGNQSVGWIGMPADTTEVVLTFNFNSAFTFGQKYTLSAGSVFGFEDGSKYTLTEEVTLYFDGSGWVSDEPTDVLEPGNFEGGVDIITFADMPVDGNDPAKLQEYVDLGFNTSLLAEDHTGALGPDELYKVDSPTLPTDEMTMQSRWGGANVLQVNTNLPVSAMSPDFAANHEGYNLIQGGDKTLWYANMINADGTVVITFNFSSNFEAGQTYVLKAGTVFGFADGSRVLKKSYIFTFDGSAWSMSVIDPSKQTVNFRYRWGGANVLQVNTNLPVSAMSPDFAANHEGYNLIQSGDKTLWYANMINADGTVVITFNFSSNFEAGQTYVLKAGTVFGFADGNSYELDGDYTFTWDGSSWTMSAVKSERPLTLSQNAANQSFIQLKTNIPTGLTYGDFLLGDSSKGHNVILETTEGAANVAWFSYSVLDGAVYLTLNFSNYNKPGTQYILKAGTTLKAGDNYYTLQQDYVMTYRNAYLESLEKLDAAGLDVWIRNYHNTADYFTENMTKALKLYQDVIDGFYMADEAFQTQALQSASGQTATTNFEDMVTLRDWFNTNFATKYFHSNQVPITSYDHYNSTTGSTLSAWDSASYKNFLASYESGILDGLTTASGASISFDNYPFIHAQGGHGGFWGIGETWESGIQKTYLVNTLAAAQVAKETGRDFSMCVQTFEAIDQNYKNTSRDIERASEVALQLYTGMAMGVDIFEYFAYNSNADFNGIINNDGTKRIYDLVKEGNQALCFQDVVNTFTWNGIMTSAGTSSNDNEDGFGYVSGMVLGDSNNGVLSSVTSIHDAIIGCFTKDSLNGYMVVNFNDPAAVTGNNTVTLTFAGCSRARVYTQTGGVLSSQVVNLTDGVYTATLAPGSACFVIPA